MRIVVAPDSFKESLTADAVARAIAQGLRQVLPDAEITQIPMADGGEGTLQALVAATGGRVELREVTGPRGERVNARFGLLGDRRTGVIEMADACGLALVPPAARDPMTTTSYGCGEIVKAALDEQLRELIIAIGGSATVDGGAGFVQALGVRFRREDGTVIEEPLTGGSLAQVASVDASGLDPRLDSVRLRVACDVNNPLLGRRGAAAVFGPQKGATPAQVDALEQNLDHLFRIVEATLEVRVRDCPGAGAAGGVGAALLAFLGAALRPGVELVMEALDFESSVARADVVITGEGRLDEQTLLGKAPYGVACVARAQAVPVIAIGGSIETAGEDALLTMFDAVETCVTRPLTVDEALAEAASAVVNAGRRVGHWLALAQQSRLS